MSDRTARNLEKVSVGEILGLALPALGVLAATPLYLLLDTAVVGRLGRHELAALGAATTIQAMVTTQLTFLSYGTTARSARLYGAGKRRDAVGEGVQATWVALAVGLVIAVVILAGAARFTGWLADDAVIAEEATAWLRVAGLGIPLILVTMAGNGWLRGIQNTRLPLWFTLAGVLPSAALVPYLVGHHGIVGSAWANLTGESITAILFLVCLSRMHGGGWRPNPGIMRRQLVMGRDLIARSLSFQVAFISAAAVAARFGAASLAAHQVMLQLWNFLSLVLDSLAIAAQALTGAALGAGTSGLARKVGTRVTVFSCGMAAVLAAVFALGHSLIPGLFTTDGETLRAMAGPWWLMVAMIVAGGVVFALDGVLLGAGDVAYLRNATIASVLLGFVPGVWLALFTGTGLTGVWCGLTAFMLLRLGFVVRRFRSMRWALPDGAVVGDGNDDRVGAGTA
ncbi:MATE family efflux transporter [Corynebacterium sp. P7202]|uniref:MATE family efflux transporter n=1 Tax=Corynebacterium pygosceleis TaxID=2800406 RepID=A0A9Q4GKP0_9CORY|nr:MATE family efflux transporter [Corynebacterium pygosceleis]MCK7636817.1 MATE family efflux transporter [Corynebacterium pygosceleis]MCX7467570.1 MATE family efflux transporter [Corynebacterium pygosceleis]